MALSGRIASATCRWLLLVADFDAADGAHAYGLPTTSRWLSYACGISARTARDHVRVARALAAHAALAASMTAGRVSYSHARIIATTVAESETGLVERLVEVAEHGTVGQLADVALGLRSVDHLADDPVRPRPPGRQESLTMSWGRDARRRLSARLDPEHAAVLEAAIAAVQSTAAEDEALTAVDALVRVAEIALAALHDSDAPPRGLRGHEQAAVVVHVDARVAEAATEMSRPPVEGGSREPHQPPVGRADQRPRVRRPNGRLHRGPGMTAAVIERLACASRVRLVVHDPNDRRTLLDLGRSARVVSDRQYRALLLRDDGHCAHPGCRSTWKLEAHHVRHWLHGGRTDRDNLVLLCGVHHTAHHKGEFAIRALGRGRFRFTRNGRTLPHHVDPAAQIHTDIPVEDEHAHVTAQAATTDWDGQRLDHAYAVACLATPRYQRPAEQQAS